MKKAHEYLLEYAVLDAKCDKCKHCLQHMDGYFVPLSVAMLAIEQVISNKMEYDFYWRSRKIVTKVDTAPVIKTLECGQKILDGTKVRDRRDGRIYDWGYWSDTGAAIVYKEGERNMQDSYAFNPNSLEIL